MTIYRVRYNKLSGCNNFTKRELINYKNLIISIFYNLYPTINIDIRMHDNKKYITIMSISGELNRVSVTEMIEIMHSLFPITMSIVGKNR